MRKLILSIYTLWVAFWFFGFFLMLWPFFWLFLQSKNTHHLAHHCNRVWGFVVYLFSACLLVVEKKYKTKPNEQYVIVANHTSYLDIPTLYLVFSRKVSFIGKSSLKKIPLFGYMYSRLHVLVDRKSSESRIKSLDHCRKKIEEGYNMIFFPEGTISKTAPILNEFKDGAFKLAIEKQIPILPVTIPNNWIILPDKKPLTVHWNVCKVVVHEPISTLGMTEKDVPRLKSKAFQIIENELKTKLGDEYRQTNS
ncbi:MAG: 1-acylglycerol-3-phosphate O-acyltransferase [Cytophagales bacterium]